MSHPLPTHEVVAVFPGQIKPGVVSVPVRMRGEVQLLTASRPVMIALRDAITEALNRPLVHSYTKAVRRPAKSPAATQPVAP